MSAGYTGSWVALGAPRKIMVVSFILKVQSPQLFQHSLIVKAPCQAETEIRPLLELFTVVKVHI